MPSLPSLQCYEHAIASQSDVVEDEERVFRPARKPVDNERSVMRSPASWRAAGAGGWWCYWLSRRAGSVATSPVAADTVFMRSAESLDRLRSAEPRILPNRLRWALSPLLVVVGGVKSIAFGGRPSCGITRYVAPRRLTCSCSRRILAFARHAACASFHYAHAACFIRQRAAAELRG